MVLTGDQGQLSPWPRINLHYLYVRALVNDTPF